MRNKFITKAVFLCFLVCNLSYAAHMASYGAQRDLEQKAIGHMLLELDSVLYVTKEAARLGISLSFHPNLRGMAFEYAGKVAGMPDGKNAFDEVVLKIWGAEARALARAAMWDAISQPALKAVQSVIQSEELLEAVNTAAEASFVAVRAHNETTKTILGKIEGRAANHFILTMAMNKLLTLEPTLLKDVIPEIRSYFTEELRHIFMSILKIVAPVQNSEIHEFWKNRFAALVEAMTAE